MHNYSSLEIKKIHRKKPCKANNKRIIKNSFGEIQKHYLQNKLIILKFLSNQKCSIFSENFELVNYINSGSSGIVFKGFDRKNPNYHLCFKFLIHNILFTIN